jgi:hypothetical protein
MAVPAPTPTSSDQMVTARCDGDSDATNDPTATLTLEPLAASADPSAPTQTVGTTVDANALVEKTSGASCAFDGAAPADRSGSFTVRCTRGGEHADVTVEVKYAVAVTSAALGVNASGGLVARVTQAAAESCQTTCGGSSSSPVGVSENGVVEVSFPSLAAGDATCSVGCTGPGGDDTWDHPFAVHVGNVLTTTDLAGLGSAEGLVGTLSLTTEDLDDPGTNDVTGAAALVVVTGNVALTDTGNGAVKYSFPLLLEIGGALRLDNNVGLIGLNADGAAERPEAFPVLTKIVGDLSITGNGALTTISFPSISNIGGSLSITGNGALTTISFPSISNIGGSLSITGNGALTTISFPSSYTLVGGSGYDFNISANSNFLTCSAIDDILQASAQCPADFLAQQNTTDCGLTCP